MRLLLLIGLLFWSVHRPVSAMPVWLDDDWLLDRWGLADGLPVLGLTGLAMPSSGFLWISSFDGLVRFDGQSFQVHNRSHHPALPSNRLGRLHEQADGDLIVVTEHGMNLRFDGHEFHPTGLTAARPGPPGDFTRASPSGSTWQVAGFTVKLDGEPILKASCGIRDLLVDRSGGVWLATDCDGLWRLRKRKVKVLRSGEELPSGPHYGMSLGADGTLWISAGRSVVAIVSGQPVSAHAIGFDGVPFRSLLADSDGSVWVGEDGTARLIDGQFVIPDGRPEALVYATARALYRSADNALWVGSGDGIWRQDATGWQRMNEHLDLPHDAIVQVFREDRHGGLWLGSIGHGLRRQLRGSAGPDEVSAVGAADWSVRDIAFDQQDRVWVATEDLGVCRSRQSAMTSDPDFDCLDERHGLPSASLHRIIDDGHGHFWFNSNGGVFRIAHPVLEATLNGEQDRVHAWLYTEMDGLPSREGNGGVQNAGLRMPDGRIAFPLQGGVAIFDPTIENQTPRPPRVALESLILPGDRHLSINDVMNLPLGERVFALRYTGLAEDLTTPLYFQYRLQSVDDSEADWMVLDREPVLSFGRMPPGQYRLQIAAVDSRSGQVGPPAAVDLELPFHWYETAAFRNGLIAALVLAILSGMIWQRRLAVTRENLLKRRVEQRTVELSRQQQATEQALETVHRQHGELTRLSAARSRFFANVSHELRTPLTLLLGPLEEQAKGRSPEAGLVAAMLGNARRLHRLVNQLLDLERIDSGHWPLNKRPCELAELAARSIGTFQSLAADRGVKLSLKQPDKSLFVLVDAEQIQQVIDNMMSNAIKFSPAGGHVSISVAQDRESVVLRVRDSGPGIAPAWHERIFDRFAQMRSEQTRAHEGAGLGLSLSREMARAHGGDLRAVEPDGDGACLVLSLPLVNAAETTTTPDTRASADLDSGQRSGSIESIPVATGPSPLKVMVVEDHAELRHWIASILSDHYQIETAGDGQQAWAAIQQQPPDLVVSDVVMPELDGLGLVRALRGDPELAGIPVILLTARADDRARIEGLSIGADQFLSKPFRAEVLLAHVASALRTCQRLRRRFMTLSGQTKDDRQHVSLGARARHWLLNNLHEDEVSVEQLASAMHMSRATLRRKLLDEGCPAPAEFIRETRLTRARELLRAGAGNVSEVAYAVGFGSLAAFSRAYRSHFGIPPSQVPSTDPEGD